MPNEMKPAVVYFVKGEGVRDNSWEAQQPIRPVIYTNPPIEQLDSVPTPFGSDLSIRIFEKGTNPIPNFLPSAHPSPSAASSATVDVQPMSTAVPSLSKAPLKTHSVTPPSMPRSSSSAIPATSLSSRVSKPVLKPKTPVTTTNAPVTTTNLSPTVTSSPAPVPNALSTMANLRDVATNVLQKRKSERLLKPPRLRNFRGSLTCVIADPREYPDLRSSTPAASSPPLSQQVQQPRPVQPSVAQQSTTQPKVVPVSAPTTTPVSAKAAQAVPSKHAPPPKPKPKAPVVSIAPVTPTPLKNPMVISPARTKPSAPGKPITPAIPAQTKVQASPPRLAKGTPPVPELPLPSPLSPTKTMRTQQQITSPSTLGRWKTSSPISPKEQRSPSLPSPTKQRTSSVTEKARAKPWDKQKGRAASPTTLEVQRKAMDNIVAKTLAHQSKSTKTLPPLAPLTPPASRPSQSSPVLPKASPSKAAVATVTLPKPLSASPPKPGRPVKPTPKEPEPVKDVSQQPHRPAEKPVLLGPERPAVSVRREHGKEATSKTTVKTPPADPASKPKEVARKASMTEPPKPSERKLLEKGIHKPSNAVGLGVSSSGGPNASTSAKTLAVKPSPAVSTPRSVSEKKGAPSAKATSSTRPAASPRSSIDGYEIGTVAGPIVTKEDQVRARRKLEAAATGATKASRPSEQAIQRKASPSDVHKGKEQRGSKAVSEPSTALEAKSPATIESSDLFNSEIQESMKSVIEQILWTVRHYKQRYAISSHDEMQSNKQRILRFIQTHLEDAASVPQKNLADDRPPEAMGPEPDSGLRRQSSSKGKGSEKPKADLRDMDLNDVRIFETFKSWRRHLEQENAPLQRLAIEARQLRQRVTSLDHGTLYFTASDLLKHLRELEELDFPIRELAGRLSAAGEEIAMRKSTNVRLEEEFQDTFRVIRSVARWLLFLSNQTSLTWKKLQKSPAEAANFAVDVFDAVLKESATGPDEASARKGLVKTMRNVKSMVGKLQNEMDIGQEGVSFCEVVAESVKTLGRVCKEGQKWREQGTESTAAPSEPHQDRSASRGPTVRSTAISRRPRHDDKPESTPELRNIKWKTSGLDGATAAQTGATQKPTFDSRARARTPNGSSPATTGPKVPSGQKFLPGIPRRPPVAEAPVSAASSQAGPSTQRPAAGNVPRWLTGDRPNLRTLMEKSARPVDQIPGDKSKDSVHAGSKRKAEDNADQNGVGSDAKPTKKRRVKFAPVLVEGEQSTPHSFAALQSLFFDGYDLLGNTTELQKNAVEERASQLSRGSVIATFGFIRSYISALKAEKDGQLVQRPEWVRLPYTPTMRRDIFRFKERRGNGLRSTPGPS